LTLADDDVVLGGTEHHYFEKLPGIHPILLRRLRRAIGTWQPDVVQVNGGRTLKYGAAAKSNYRRSAWVLVYRSIGQPRSWVRGGLHRGFYSTLVMPRVDGVVAVSSATQQALRELYDLSVPIARIPRAVDPLSLVPAASWNVVRRETRIPEDARMILYVGSLTQEKRLDRLLRVFARLRGCMTGLFLCIVGGGPTRASLEAQVHALSLESCVRFMGVKEDVASYMNAADVVALTSDTEGMPGVALEAGMLRRPVVATRVGGVSECVLHGQTGLVVEPGDEEGFVQALRSLLEQPERLRRLGDAAGKWTEENFTLARIAQQYEAFYADVLARRPRRRTAFRRPDATARESRGDRPS
jgi:glycosyltransferase involved in cell wall biosynthesis